MSSGCSWFWYVPAAAIALGILLLSTVFSVPIQIAGISYLDKWEHTFAYFCLTLSWLYAFSKVGKLSSKWVRVILLCIVLYGIFLELVQYVFFPNRLFEWLDATANTLGSLLGVFTFTIIRTYGKRP